MQTEKEKKILEMQAPSTREALSQSAAERIAHRLSEIPKSAQCVKEDDSVDLNVRFISANDEQAEQRLRRSRGAMIELGRDEKHATGFVVPSQEVRDRAIKAYMGGFSVGAIKDKFSSMMKAMFAPSHAEIVAEQMRGVKK